ncbi:MAG: hypothetical protein QOH58_1814 [Thermoleophilaceae bacterium]|jgi:nitrite reductase/ring-hydroxylating ferredoxin subunit|nr:hypothetical protein [Thermoleophilaceae bacterium]
MLDDFQPGAMALREVDGRAVAIVRWGDDLYAVSNSCPHMGGPLCQGHLGPRIGSARAGSIELDPTRPTLSCSWHGWEFDLATGSALWDDEYSVRTYPVEVAADGRVLLDTRRRRRAKAEA